MSAETIPSDVPDDVWAIADAETRRGVWLPRGEVAQAIVRAILTDRSTRPAEPAAPVAEAGDDRVCMCGALEKDHSAYDGHSFVDMEKHQTAQDQAERWGYSQGHTKGFEEGGRIERKRADFLEAELEKANATLEAERARADAAEQRAADALACAEKAEGAADGWCDMVSAPRDASEIIVRMPKRGWPGYYRQIAHWAEGGGDDQPPFRGWFRYMADGYVELPAEPTGWMPLTAAAARASREAQPATDGGDNG